MEAVFVEMFAAQIFMGRFRSLASSRICSWRYLLSLWIVCLILIGRSVLDAWSFPWYGNPDQDLVFLRDGLRLWAGRVPGYGDHPGLMQMVVVWVSLGLLKLAGGLGILHEFHFEYPSNADWQLLFRLAKLVNGLLMAGLLTCCGALLASLLGRLSGIVWVALCAASMALVSETYQLRNEFFSSFLAIAAILLSINVFAWCRSGWLDRLDFLQRQILFWIAGLGSLCLCYVALMAKVQVLPVLLIFVFWSFFAGSSLLGSRFIHGFYYSFGSLVLGLLLISIPLFRGMDLSLAQAVIVVIGLLGPSALFFTACRVVSSWLPRQRLWIGLASMLGSITAALMFLPFAKQAQWLQLLVNPSSVRAYAAASEGCRERALACVFQGGARGFFYLFERSIDSYALAPVMALAVLTLLVVAFAMLVIRRVRPGALDMSTQWLLAWSGCGCITIALLMAFVAGQRWAVDHYLPYQQPFLFAGLLILSRKKMPFFRVWALLLLLVALSVPLVYLRYPAFARATYVKENIRVTPDQFRGDGSLCASQHAGSEWDGSSLRSLCRDIWK